MHTVSLISMGRAGARVQDGPKWLPAGMSPSNSDGGGTYRAREGLHYGGEGTGWRELQDPFLLMKSLQRSVINPPHSNTEEQLQQRHMEGIFHTHIQPTAACGAEPCWVNNRCI